ncbi:MAG: septal ring lytic transglycosylase RlpA family protein [Candidatus Hydrogenedentes bacterium]|jgi:rare lipoprotein A|nr:septal ring lytic transglycosylase RlpA family protein [Candidatus Hydrogenedentota bacterium]
MLEVLAIVLYSQQPIVPVEEGIASYYTVASSSPLTASGEAMDDGALTCAMLEGEFGAYYRVTAENGRRVVCRLNDRGPYVKGRLIDLSRAAMRALHPTAGLLNVTVERIPERELPPWLWSGG